MRENEVMETELMDENYEEIEESNGGFNVGAAVGLGLAGLGVVGAIAAFLNRDKIRAWSNERKIRKLESQGFIVSHPDIVDVAEYNVVEETIE